MSCQPSPQPQASGTAAATASSGTTTNSATRKRSRKEPGSASTSGSGARGEAAGGPGGPVTRASGGAVMGFLALLGAPRAGDYAYVTVTYEDVGYAREERRFHLDVGRVTRIGRLRVSHREMSYTGSGVVAPDRKGRAGMAPGGGFAARLVGPKALGLA